MKNLIKATFILTVMALAACNNNVTSKEAGNDSQKEVITHTDTSITEVTPTFTGLDKMAAANIKTIVDGYLHLKNALAIENSSEAATDGKAISDALKKVDKSLLTADQKKLYEGKEDDLQKLAALISNNSGNIGHQRESFSRMSEDIYALIKGYGGGQTLYKDHCPMYKDKGAIWISETAEIKNPYLGAQMATCGEVKEKIK